MTLDLTNPTSIIAWYRWAPDRHGPQLAWMKTTWPQFAEAIEQAGQMLRSAR